MPHDFVSFVFQNMGLEYLNSSGRVVIGNNVSFGRNVTVLKGVTIDDNVFIGAGSIVTKDIPSNCLAVGTPCKPIISIEAYYDKRKKLCVDEAIDFARSIKERFDRLPFVEEFREEFPLFIDGSDTCNPGYSKLKLNKVLGNNYEQYIKTHTSVFKDFNDFLSKAGVL